MHVSILHRKKRLRRTCCHANFQWPSRSTTRPSRLAASMNHASWSIVLSYPGANLSIDWIRSTDMEPKFVSMPSMNCDPVRSDNISEMQSPGQPHLPVHPHLLGLLLLYTGNRRRLVHGDDCNVRQSSLGTEQ